MHLLLFVLASAAAAMQQPAAATPQPPAPATANPAPAPPAPPPTETYVYQPAGRRDPFLNLIGSGSEGRPMSRRSDGPSGMTLAEISVRGVVQSRGSLVAMIQGPDNKTYIVRSGDRLLDGAVKTITQDGVVFSQDVNDPLSLVKQREVPKRVRAGEGRG